MSFNTDPANLAPSGEPTPTPSRPIHPDYHLRDGYPNIPEYLGLRRTPNLSHKTEEQAILALPGSWFGCCVVHTETNTTVGMGRIVGDGGWYFHIVDMVVAAEHQRKGLGDVVLARLLERIREVAPPGAWVSLLADPPGRKLYAKHGFKETAPHSIGMALDL
ncbi:hypothetical protein PABG_03378 [Paracoccidioides brasiliensis Pb03]|uniref:N-acetyltransferase domain-containing protein n=1 Tax=Paracoccidioides brasiliensis (strain Pb18) TaxID=502780 RepID=C1G4S8_PARBD|nr:uncharacterized protein PADG_01944 [Paracoccidioides brasiliensis Pb18]EEH21147.1 hypothetical protein PABG_03378 [Paracoccidioides brasiliensis Pb03]EEH45794.1 hypothetical protein PADG_01944 [Paracoccidioides brasiliensis Pb18]ODH53042.1 hypothetical protein GX48_00912 [Paracoccidioides brasiliensis]